MPITVWGSTRIAHTMFGRTIEPPEVFYLALIKEIEPDPFISGQELDEPDVEDYVRLEISNGIDDWTQESTETHVKNLNELRFPIAVEDWGEIAFWALCNAPEEGYVYAWGEFSEHIYVAADDEVVIDPELLVFEFSMIYQEMTTDA